jgi:hypothetical protein
MPETCFSYSTSTCFTDPTGGSCFTYPSGPCFSQSTRASRVAGDRPGTFGGGGGDMGPCFGYSGDVFVSRLGRTPGQPSGCFSYSAPPITHPNVTGYPCFRY